MEKALKLINDNKLIKPGEKIGVACSGGRDSMALLNFLFNLSKIRNFKICAINIDHSIREKSSSESAFVKNYCNKFGIEFLSFVVDVPALVKKEKIGLEEGARIARYKIFDSLIQNKTVDKIALGHHISDQAESILLNILRGSGLNGAKGMSIIKENGYIRPLLSTSRNEINAYNEINNIPFIDDESNFNNDYSRNYIRNVVLPLLRTKWNSADELIARFGETCKKDNDFINSLVPVDKITISSGTAKVLINYLVGPVQLSSRLITFALNKIGVNKDIEQKHINAVINLATVGKNGNKINLTNRIVATKEYNEIVLSNKDWKNENISWNIVKGRKNIADFGIIETTITRKLEFAKFTHLIDYNKVPKSATWRFREDGDVFEKFGGGTKSLNDYFIDKKIPKRLRDFIPVIAVNNEILLIAGVEISRKVKLDESTKTAYGFNIVKY